MNEMKSTPFGLNIEYYFKNINEHSDNLVNLVSKNGFDSFSPEGISSFFTFRFPIGNLTMFKDYFRFLVGPN